MQRSKPKFPIIRALCVFAGAAMLLLAGCSHHATPAAPPASVATAAAPGAPVPAPVTTPAANPPNFQPYTLLPQPAPVPKVVTHRHRVLRLVHQANHVYLADSDGHAYQVGRDRQGHIYPVYRDPATQATYPLYYDNQRDRLYRVARNDDGHYYRGYVGDDSARFYADGNDYERIGPSNASRPVIEDSYNNTYNTYNYGNSPGSGSYHYSGYPGTASPSHSSHHSNNLNWLWAIPVIVGAYLLLRPHHHSSPPPAPAPTTIVVRQSNPVTIINRYGGPRYVQNAPYPQNGVYPQNPPPPPPAVAPTYAAARPLYRPAPVSIPVTAHSAALVRPIPPRAPAATPVFAPHSVLRAASLRPRQIRAAVSARPHYHPRPARVLTLAHWHRARHFARLNARPVMPVPAVRPAAHTVALPRPVSPPQASAPRVPKTPVTHRHTDVPLHESTPRVMPQETHAVSRPEPSPRPTRVIHAAPEPRPIERAKSETRPASHSSPRPHAAPKRHSNAQPKPAPKHSSPKAHSAPPSHKK